MIVFLVEFQQLLILEVGDGFRVPTRVELVLTVFEQVGVDILNKSIFRVAHCSFHLVVDHSFDLKGSFWVVPLLEL